ncbi:DUF1292 domain-containing protein [Bacillus sp. B15-48]|uniref:DUF1292 domain-containing protein n=1 Tax=Bacillus sp. B15-48 TaxID=1548601 RepID=UPI00193F7729|nr:DUF1292 domain-containing protein [Bacillus sp. B15-48]MBM4761886.1 DUF1292 domain-containing protein [Bacillus sp. B15-48]
MGKAEIGEVFTISDENNEDQEVEVLASITNEGIEYVAVSFVEDLKGENIEDIDVFFLKVDEDGDFSAIESDEEFEKVSLMLDEMMDEEELD